MIGFLQFAFSVVDTFFYYLLPFLLVYDFLDTDISCSS